VDSVAWEREFDLVVMTGHAFQVLVEDDQLRASLAAIGSALSEEGRLVFETRARSRLGAMDAGQRLRRARTND
jgi:hypothetical protein